MAEEWSTFQMDDAKLQHDQKLQFMDYLYFDPVRS